MVRKEEEEEEESEAQTVLVQETPGELEANTSIVTKVSVTTATPAGLPVQIQHVQAFR